jgi:hypothetical protein
MNAANRTLERRYWILQCSPHISELSSRTGDRPLECWVDPNQQIAAGDIAYLWLRSDEYLCAWGEVSGNPTAEWNPALRRDQTKVHVAIQAEFEEIRTIRLERLQEVEGLNDLEPLLREEWSAIPLKPHSVAGLNNLMRKVGVEPLPDTVVNTDRPGDSTMNEQASPKQSHSSSGPGPSSAGASPSYALSPSLERIVDRAMSLATARSLATATPLTSSCLLFALTDEGESRPASPTARFLASKIAGLDGYREVRTQYPASALSKGPLQELTSVAKTPNVRGILGAAEEIALATTYEHTLHVRHLLGALLTYSPAGRETGAQARLRQMGLNLAEVRQAFLAFLGRVAINPQEVQPWQSFLVEEKGATPEVGGMLPFSRDASGCINRGCQIQDDLKWNIFPRSILLAGVMLQGKRSAASAFLGALGVKRDELIARLCDMPERELRVRYWWDRRREPLAEITQMDSLSVPFTAECTRAFVIANRTAQDRGASEIELDDIFIGLMRSNEEAPGATEQTLGTRRSDWIRRTISDWPPREPFDEKLILRKAVKSGFYTPPTAFCDSASREDLLGFELSANALVDIILKDKTVPPMVIGIYGPWGSGKSTFMELVKNKLDSQAIKSDGRVRVNEPRLITVHYDAWAYADAPKLWAGLIAKIAGELDKELGLYGRLLYMLKRQVRRVIVSVVLGLVPVGLGLFLLLGRSSLGWAAHLTWITTIIAVVQGFFAQRRPVSSAVASLAAGFDSGSVVGVIHNIQDEFRNALKTRLSPPDESDQAGKLTIAQEVRENRLKIVVFIDELDRCPLERIVDILEAIKLFLAEEIFIVFLAIDTRVAAEAIRLHYKDVTNPDLPRQYLEKIVQIPLRVPSSNREQIGKYLGRFMNPVADELVTAVVGGARHLGTPRSDIPDPPKASPVEKGTDRSEPLPASTSQAKTTTSNAGTGKTEGGAKKHGIHSPGIPSSLPELPDTQAEFDFLREIAETFLDGNPRRIKRILNTYRYIKIVANACDEPVDATEWQRTTLAWLAFTMKWPSFMTESIRQANLLDASEGADDAFLLSVLEGWTSASSTPEENDIKTRLNISAQKTKRLWTMAPNFLIENPEPTRPQLAASRPPRRRRGYNVVSRVPR